MDFRDLESTNHILDYIRENIPNPDLLEQLAEEAAELSHAALKLARIRRGVNPTPISESTAIANVIEELSDVVLVGKYVLNYGPDGKIIYEKLGRWKERIENAN